MIHLRAAGRLDVGPMVDLLNEIIAMGGATAMTEPLTREVLTSWMYTNARSYWHLAETDSGDLAGFQWVDPHHSIGEHVAQIGTFTRVGQTGTGVGTALMDAMKRQCRALGYEWINAEIRADNAGGLIYYRKSGFEDYGRIQNYTLDNGQVVDKILRRYDL